MEITKTNNINIVILFYFLNNPCAGPTEMSDNQLVFREGDWSYTGLLRSVTFGRDTNPCPVDLNRHGSQSNIPTHRKWKDVAHRKLISIKRSEPIFELISNTSEFLRR